MLCPKVNNQVSSTVFYVFDERGNTTARLDHTGAILSRHITDAYGATLNAPALVGNLGGGVPDTTYLTDPYAGFGGKFGYYIPRTNFLYLPCLFCGNNVVPL
jgi:hypothetical protein